MGHLRGWLKAPHQGWATRQHQRMPQLRGWSRRPHAFINAEPSVTHQPKPSLKGHKRKYRQNVSQNDGQRRRKRKRNVPCAGKNTSLLVNPFPYPRSPYQRPKTPHIQGCPLSAKMKSHCCHPFHHRLLCHNPSGLSDSADQTSNTHVFPQKPCTLSSLEPSTKIKP